MQLYSNAHTHTVFCDGRNTPEEMIREALKHNFVSLGFSIHAWTPYDDSNSSTEREPAYLKELARLREQYAGQIEVIAGVECDSLYARSYEGYAYRIESSHFIAKDSLYLPVDRSEQDFLNNVADHFSGDYMAYARAFYDQEIHSYLNTQADFAGHIDLVAKYNEGNKYFDESGAKYLSMAFEAADCAVERGLPIEINTGAISRGYKKLPYPALPILRHIHDIGGEILINSDCHFREGLTTGFDLAVQLAVESGFDHILRLRASGFEEIGLE